MPPASTTHAQEAARVVDGEARGVRGVGWVVGAGARRAGRSGSRRGRKAPGRLPGRLLLWASAPPRLTNCRRCGKIPHEGSHRRRPQRRPSSKVRQKPGRFRYDRALLHRRRGSTQKWDSLPSLRSGWDDFTIPQLHPSTQHHATARAISCDAAIFLPASGISPQAAPQPSRKSSPRTCCYGSSPSARARCRHTGAAAPRRTPSGSYAGPRSAVAGTPLQPASHPARPPDVSGASGSPVLGKPNQSHRIPNAVPKSTCPAGSPDAASPSSAPQSKIASQSATGAATKRR